MAKKAKKAGKKKTTGKKATKRKKGDPSKPLANAKHELFCREYQIDNNATQSYIRVYNCCVKTADTGGPRLMGNVGVMARVRFLKEKMISKLDVDAARVIAEYAKLAFSNMADYTKLNDMGDLVPDLSKCTRDQLAALESLKTKTTTIKTRGKGKNKGVTTASISTDCEFKLHKKREALRDLGKHLGIFKKDNDQKFENLASAIHEAMV